MQTLEPTQVPISLFVSSSDSLSLEKRTLGSVAVSSSNSGSFSSRRRLWTLMSSSGSSLFRQRSRNWLRLFATRQSVDLFSQFFPSGAASSRPRNLLTSEGQNPDLLHLDRVCKGWPLEWRISLRCCQKPCNSRKYRTRYLSRGESIRKLGISHGV